MFIYLYLFFKYYKNAAPCSALLLAKRRKFDRSNALTIWTRGIIPERRLQLTARQFRVFAAINSKIQRQCENPRFKAVYSVAICSSRWTWGTTSQESNSRTSNFQVHRFIFMECTLSHDFRDFCLSFNQFRNELKTLLYRETLGLPSITASVFAMLSS